MARKLKRYKKGGRMPKYNLGAVTGIASTAGSLMGGAANAFTDDPNKEEQNNAFFKSIGFGLPGMIIGAFRANKVRKEQEKAEQLAAQQAREQRRANFMAGLEATPNYNPIFPLGGIIPYGPGYNQPNAELETDEVYRLPNGQIQDVPENTPSHERGGIEMQLPPGTEILGEGKYQGEEFKDLGQKLERLYKKHQKILKNRPTPLAKSTSEKMLNKVQKQYSNLMQEQEQKRGNGTLNKQEYKYGGEVKKYSDGTGYLVDEPVSFQTFASPTPYMDAATGNTTYNNFGQDVPLRNPRTGMYNVPDVPVTENRGGSPNVDWGKIGNIAEIAGMYAPIAYNAIRGMFSKPDIISEGAYQNPYEQQVMGLMQGRRFNVNPILDRNRIAQRTFNRNARNVGATPGTVLGNLQAGAAARMRADTAALAEKQNVDNQYLAQEAQTMGALGQTRADRAFQIRDINDRNRAAQRNYLPTALSQLQQGLQVDRQMRNQATTDRLGLAALSDLVPSYWFNYDYFNQLRNNRRTPITGSLYRYRGE